MVLLGGEAANRVRWRRARDGTASLEGGLGEEAPVVGEGRAALAASAPTESRREKLPRSASYGPAISPAMKAVPPMGDPGRVQLDGAGRFNAKACARPGSTWAQGHAGSRAGARGGRIPGCSL